VAVGFEELQTPEEVDNALQAKNDETILVVVNSVCGCAAGSARPGVSLALQNSVIPDKLYTVFAGQDRDATDRARGYAREYPPSSPSAMLFKNGELLFFLPRYAIEGYTSEQIAGKLTDVFNKNCTGHGPSITPEQFAEVEYAKQCGSKIPLFRG
jgi:putative YphP/YqiW family bacilliredoxin